MINVRDAFLKALESLAGAESEYANGRYNNCANRCYYSCFHGAIHALIKAGVVKAESQLHVSHAYVQAQFVEQLIERRKIYPSGLRDTLARNHLLRQEADYRSVKTSEKQASRALARSRALIHAIGGVRQ